jgi:hypothetical protein
MRDVSQRELADQLSLVEAIPFSLGRKLGQAVQGQSSFRALAGLPLDRVDRSPGRCLCCRHAGGGQRLHRNFEAVWKLKIVGIDAGRRQ